MGGGAVLLGSRAARGQPGPHAAGPVVHHVQLDLGNHHALGDLAFRSIVVATPDRTVAAALVRDCHRVGLQRAVRWVVTRLSKGPAGRGRLGIREIEAQLAQAVEGYLRPLTTGPLTTGPLTTGPLAPLRVSLIIIPPPAPRPPRPPVRLGGVPVRPRFGGCASCSTAEDGAGGSLPTALALAIALLRLRSRGGAGDTE